MGLAVCSVRFLVSRCNVPRLRGCEIFPVSKFQRVRIGRSIHNRPDPLDLVVEIFETCETLKP